MKRAEKLILVFGLIIAFSIAGAIILIISLSDGGYTEREVSLRPFTAPQTKEAVVTFFSGEVFYYRDSSWKPVAVGEILKENDFIKTFENSYCEIQIGEKISFSMRENALLKLYVVLQTEDKTQSDSEILIGTVLYKVTHLDEKDEVTIRAGARAFGVRGTEFLIDRKADNTTCAVLKGEVAIIDPDNKKDTLKITPNKEVTLADKQTAEAVLASLSNDSSNILNTIQNMSTVAILGTDPLKLVKTGIEVVPASAEIYINNQLAGTGAYGGIYPSGSEITVRLHKEGYKDQSFKITPKQGENRIYVFKLELDQPEKGIITEISVNETEIKLQALEKRISTLSAEKELFRQEIDLLKRQKAKIELELRAKEKQVKEMEVKINEALEKLQ